MSEERVAEECEQAGQEECQQDSKQCICSAQALPLWVWGSAAFAAGYMMLQLQLAA